MPQGLGGGIPSPLSSLPSYSTTTSLVGSSQYPYIKASERQVLGTNGGTPTLSAWTTRTLTTLDNDTTGAASLSSNQLSIPAGTYRVRARSPFFGTKVSRIRLFDVTNSAVLLLSESCYFETASSAGEAAIIGKFTATTPLVIRIEYWAANSPGTNGLGVAGSITSTVEVYSELELWQEPTTTSVVSITPPFGFIQVSNTLASTTGGGTPATGAWTTRALNTVDADTTSQIAITTNAFVLPAGTYRLRGRSSFLSTGITRLRLFNVTDSSVITTGSSSSVASGSTEDVLISGRFTLATAKNVRLEYWATSANANGLGNPDSIASTSEIYTVLEFEIENAATTATPTYNNLLGLASYDYINVTYETAVNTNGGAASATAWTVRPLSTIKADTTGQVTLATNIVTLPAGTYRFRGAANFYGCNYSFVRLYDVTNSAVLVAPGESGIGAAANLHAQRAETNGRFTLTGPTQIRLEYYIDSILSAGTFNLGPGSGGAGVVSNSLHTNLEFWKEPSTGGQFMILPGVSYDYIKASEVQVSGTNGGTGAITTWTTRTINTLDADTTGLVSLGSNQLTLPAGTYRFRIRTPFYSASYMRTRLFNVTDSSVIQYSASNYCRASSGFVTTDSMLTGRFTITATKIVRVEYYMTATVGTQDLGVPNAIAAINEIFTELEFWKEPASTVVTPAYNKVVGLAQYAYTHLSEQQVSGTVGGSAVTTTWTPRILNTIDSDQIGVTLPGGTGQFTLPAGTYRIKAKSQFYQAFANRIRLFNVTDSAIILVGASDWSNNTSGVPGQGNLEGRFTIAGTKTLRIEYWAGSGNGSTQGLGIATAVTSTNEIFTIVELWQEPGAQSAIYNVSSGAGDYVYAREQQTSTTVGGTPTLSAWTARVLNTLVTDTTAQASLSTNQLSLPAGTYRIKGRAPFFASSITKLRLYDVTNSAVLLTGGSNYMDNVGSSFNASDAVITGRITLSATTIIRLEYYCTASTGSTQGLGVANSITSTVEVYAELECFREPTLLPTSPQLNQYVGTPAYPYAVISEQQTSGTAGGISTAAAWTTRILNTIEVDQIGVTLPGSNTFTLPAGTYRISARSPFMFANLIRIRLYNVTDSAVQAYGASQQEGGATQADVDARLITRFTITATKTFRIEYFTDSRTSNAVNLGSQNSSGVNEVYTQIEVWQEPVPGNIIPISSPTKYVQVSNTLASTTAGGTPATGAWTTRALNTVDTDTTGLVSITTNVMSLPAGVYRLRGRSSFLSTGITRVRLYDQTNSAVLLTGSSSSVASGSTEDVLISGRFTLTATTSVRLEYWATSANANGLGNPDSIASTSEIYTVLEFEVEPQAPIALNTVGAGQAIKISEVQLSGYQGNYGNAASANAWTTRVLNNIDFDQTGTVTIANNKITLPAGNYRVTVRAPAYGVAAHKINLINDTTNAVLIYGDSCLNSSAGLYSIDHAMLTGRIVLTAQTVVRIDHWVTSLGTTGNYTLGYPVSIAAVSEVYTVAEFTLEPTANSVPLGLQVTTANTLNIATADGFDVPGAITNFATGVITGATAGNIFTATSSHGLVTGDRVSFSSLTGGSSLAANIQYYIISPTALTFQISTTPGGSAQALGSNVTACVMNKINYLGVTLPTNANSTRWRIDVAMIASYSGATSTRCLAAAIVLGTNNNISPANSAILYPITFASGTAGTGIYGAITVDGIAQPMQWSFSAIVTVPAGTTPVVKVIIAARNQTAGNAAFTDRSICATPIP